VRDPYGASAGGAGFPPLVCPTARTLLQPEGDSLIGENGVRFPVVDGIPRIVASGAAYADAFGEQWNKYRETQLDSYTGTDISAKRVERCLGPELHEMLRSNEPKHVLEAGCGAGRFTEVLLRYPAAVVTSTDLSSAVDANQRNFPQGPRHRIVQCDISLPPFPPESFDVVVCLGVIQHTPDPEKTIASLYAQVKPGGWLVIDHYAPSLSHYTKITALVLRPILKRLSPKRGTEATEVLTRLFFPLHRLVKHRPLLQKCVSRVSPLLTYHHSYPELDDRLQYEWALLDTHDSLTDYYKHLRSAEDIRRALTALGADSIAIEKGGNGVEARCRKPAR
jgi:SAM-dependent methyltransferase